MTALRLTLTLADTNYNLRTLAIAQVSTLVDLPGPWDVRADEGNGSATVLIGDSSLSATRYAASMVAGETKSCHSLAGTYCRSASAGQIVNVSVER